MKKISVITVCYNAAKTIEETINSVIRQDYPEIEYIIIDGGSTDGTIEIVNKYRDKIAYFVSEPDKGISDAFNKGIKASNGEIIGIINADDLYYKDALKTVGDFFEEKPDTDVTFGDFLLFSNGDYLGRRKNPGTNLSDLKFAFKLSHPTVFVRKSAYETFGLFSQDYKLAMDYELLSKMYFCGAKFRYINEIISCYRNGGVSQLAQGSTYKEHKQIALRNGSSLFEINKFLWKVKTSGFIVTALKKIGIFYWLRGRLQPSESYNVIWWEE